MRPTKTSRSARGCCRRACALISRSSMPLPGPSTTSRTIPRLPPTTRSNACPDSEAGILGQVEDPAFETAHRMRASLAATGVASRHCLDLIAAFKQDATKGRYDDWDDLMGYCILSAAPVGRYLLDLHGGSRDGYGSSDALCMALQVINHLQDCQDDYRQLDRVYLPGDWMAEAGAEATDLDRDHADLGHAAGPRQDIAGDGASDGRGAVVTKRAQEPALGHGIGGHCRHCRSSHRSFTAVRSFGRPRPVDQGWLLVVLPAGRSLPVPSGGLRDDAVGCRRRAFCRLLDLLVVLPRRLLACRSAPPGDVAAAQSVADRRRRDSRPPTRNRPSVWRCSRF